jgi:hypothetical protein
MHSGVEISYRKITQIMRLNVIAGPASFVHALILTFRCSLCRDPWAYLLGSPRCFEAFGSKVGLPQNHYLIFSLDPVRYQNIFRIVIWFFFLFVYSKAGIHYLVSPWFYSNLVTSSRAPWAAEWWPRCVWSLGGSTVRYGIFVCYWRYVLQFR